jgi:hypothetical protein
LLASIWVLQDMYTKAGSSGKHDVADLLGAQQPSVALQV